MTLRFFKRSSLLSFLSWLSFLFLLLRCLIYRRREIENFSFFTFSLIPLHDLQSSSHSQRKITRLRMSFSLACFFTYWSVMEGSSGARLSSISCCSKRVCTSAEPCKRIPTLSTRTKTRKKVPKLPLQTNTNRRISVRKFSRYSISPSSRSPRETTYQRTISQRKK